MSGAFKCDRCGDFVGDKPGIVIEAERSAGLNDTLELCPQCVRDYERWEVAVFRPATEKKS